MANYETIPERIRRQHPNLSNKEVSWAVADALLEPHRQAMREREQSAAHPHNRAFEAIQAVGFSALRIANNDQAAATTLLETTTRIFQNRNTPKKIDVMIYNMEE